MNLLYHLFLSLSKSHYSFFPKLLGLVKYSLRCIFISLMNCTFIMKRIFLMTGTSNSQIKQDLENTENAIECSNQAFLLQLMQYTVLHCHDEKQRPPILTVFLLWRLSIYQADCIILQNWWFHLEEVYNELHFPVSLNGQKNFLWVKKDFLLILDSLLILDQVCFRCRFWYKIQISSDKSL